MQADQEPQRSFFSSIAPYIFSALIAILGAIVVMHLWHMNSGVPLYYSRGGDELLMLACTKTIIDGGWCTTISHLGAPFAMSLAGFASPGLLHMAILRIITLFVHHAPVALNLYFIAGFPIIAVVGTYVLRHMGVSSGAAVAASVVYSLLPLRFTGNEGDLLYTQYYALPFLILAVVWVLHDHNFFDVQTPRPTADGYILLIGLLAVSWTIPLVAAFGIVLLALAAVASLIRTRAWRGVVVATLESLVLLVGIAVNSLPTTAAVFQRDLISVARGGALTAPLVAFVLLAAAAYGLTAIRRRWLGEWNGIWAGGLTLLMALTIFVQFSATFVPAYAADLQTYQTDDVYATTIERRLPANAELYQLPREPFPSTAPVVKLGPSQQAALSLQSRSLRYSYGTMRGSAADAWQLHADASPLHSFLEQLLLAGFDGVLVYTAGYRDRGTRIENALAAQFGEAPMVRNDGATAFFDLSRLRSQYASLAGVAKAAAAQNAVLSTQVDARPPDPALLTGMRVVDRLLADSGGSAATGIAVSFGSGCYGEERSEGSTWHWCGAKGQLTVYNRAQEQHLKLLYTLTTAQPAHVTVDVNGVWQRFTSSPEGSPVAETILARPGVTLLRFSTDAKPVVTLADPRHLVVQISNLRALQSTAGDAR